MSIRLTPHCSLRHSSTNRSHPAPVTFSRMHALSRILCQTLAHRNTKRRPPVTCPGIESHDIHNRGTTTVPCNARMDTVSHYCDLAINALGILTCKCSLTSPLSSFSTLAAITAIGLLRIYDYGNRRTALSAFVYANRRWAGGHARVARRHVLACAGARFAQAGNGGCVPCVGSCRPAVVQHALQGYVSGNIATSLTVDGSPHW